MHRKTTGLLPLKLFLMAQCSCTDVLCWGELHLLWTRRSLLAPEVHLQKTRFHSTADKSFQNNAMKTYGVRSDSVKVRIWSKFPQGAHLMLKKRIMFTLFACCILPVGGMKPSWGLVPGRSSILKCSEHNWLSSQLSSPNGLAVSN